MTEIETVVPVVPVVAMNSTATPSVVHGTFHAYDAQIEIPEIEGTRIVKCLYQINGKTGKKVRENEYCRVPTDHIDTSVTIQDMIDCGGDAAELAPYVITWLYGIEDLQIKADHRKGLTSVYCDGLSIEKLMAYLDELDLGGRLNKDMIGTWFDNEVAEYLTVLFAAKIGLDLDSTVEVDENLVAKLELILVAYKGKFESLAGGRSFVAEDQCDAMLGVINAVSSENGAVLNGIGSKLVIKLEKMRAREVETLLSL